MQFAHTSGKAMHHHHIHMMGGHEFMKHFNALTHDSRFWAIVGLTALLALMIALAIIGAGSGSGTLEHHNIYYPYGIRV